jgi:peptidoglycan/LPS O-acetylase OafA/YrhL
MLKAAVELGLIGTLGLLCYLVLPVVTALTARRRSADPELRTLAAAVAGACAAGSACGLTFDSMSFGTFAGVFSLLVGLAGACWVISASERRPVGENQVSGTRLTLPVQPRR